MNKIKFFLIVYLATVVILSCTKTESQLIDNATANERYMAYVSDVKANLLSAEGGWMGMLNTPKSGNGYTIFFDFKEEGRVSMYSDFTEEAMNVSKESSFAFRNTGKPYLIFDTYNYLHLLADPNSSVNSGQSGSGLYADFEFTIVKSTPDSVVLRGNLNNNDLLLIRLSSEDRQKLEAGILEDNVEEFAAYFKEIENGYLDVAVDGESKQLAIDFIDNRKVSYQVLEKGQIVNLSGPLYYGLNKDIRLGKGNQYKDVSFVSAVFKQSKKLVFVDDRGKEYEVLQASSPIIPLPPFLDSFGEDKRYFSAEFRPAMANAQFKPIWDAIQNESINGTNQYIGYMRMALLKNGELYLRVYRYDAGAGTTGSAKYSRLYFKPVIHSNGSLSYTYISKGSDGGSSSTSLRNNSTVLESFLKDNEFMWDWKNKGMTEGGMFVVDDLGNKIGVAFTGTLGTS